MVRLAKWLGLAAAGLWGGIVFLASNSPADVKQRASGWLTLPIVRELPERVIAFAASPTVLALTFFAIGSLVGWKVNKWLASGDTASWAAALAGDMLNRPGFLGGRLV